MTQPNIGKKVETSGGCLVIAGDIDKMLRNIKEMMGKYGGSVRTHSRLKISTTNGEVFPNEPKAKKEIDMTNILNKKQ